MSDTLDKQMAHRANSQSDGLKEVITNVEAENKENEQVAPTPTQDTKPKRKYTRRQKTTESSDNVDNKQANPKPKRKCTEKQLAALAAGRMKNPRFKNKMNKMNEEGLNEEYKEAI